MIWRKTAGNKVHGYPHTQDTSETALQNLLSIVSNIVGSLLIVNLFLSLLNQSTCSLHLRIKCRIKHI